MSLVILKFLQYCNTELMLCFIKSYSSFHSGKGIGSLVTGKLFDPYTGVLGEVWTFRAYSIVALIVLVIYAAINILFFRHKQSPASPRLEKTDKQSGNGNIQIFQEKMDK